MHDLSSRNAPVSIRQFEPVSFEEMSLCYIIFLPSLHPRLSRLELRGRNVRAHI